MGSQNPGPAQPKPKAADLVQCLNKVFKIISAKFFGCITYSTYDRYTQHAEWDLNRIEITFNGTFTG